MPSTITKLSQSLPLSPTLQFSLHSHTHFSILKLNKASRFEITHLSIHVSHHKKVTQCSCTASVTDPQAETGSLYPLFREMGLNEIEFQSLLERNPEFKIESFDKIRKRVVSLESVRLCGSKLGRLVVKYPNVLTSEEVESLIRFVCDDLGGKVEPMQLKRVLVATEPRLLVGFDKKVRLLISLGVPKEKIGHVLNNVNLTRAICHKSVEELENIISFLAPYGGVELVLRRPKILNFDLDKQLIPRVEFIKELSGGDDDATKTVLLKLPALLSYTVEHMRSHAEALKSLAGLNDQEVFKIFYVFPNVVSASRERKLRPRIAFLKECGFDSSEIFKFLSKAPLFLGLSFEENLAYKLALLVKIGYEFRTKELAVAMGAVTRTSCENLQKVLGLFLSYGLSYADILLMSKKHPQILQYNPKSLEEKIEYLINEMGREVRELLAFPAFLGYNLDDRIKLRYELEKLTRGEVTSLNKLLTISENRFSGKNGKT